MAKLMGTERLGEQKCYPENSFYDQLVILVWSILLIPILISGFLFIPIPISGF